MDRYLNNAAVITTALLEELGHPIKAVWSRGGAWATKGIALLAKRLNVLLVDTDSRGDVHVCLAGLVDPGKSGLIRGDE